MPALDDLSNATRELFQRSMTDEVYMRTPFIEELQRRRQITVGGGKYVERLVDTAEIDSLVQEYTTNQALTDGKLSTLDKPRFYWRKAQLPMRYDVDEDTQNISGSKEEQLLNLATHLTKKSQRGSKLWLNKKCFNNGSTTPVADGSGVSAPQSIISALDHDSTYGTLTRSFSGGTRDWWQSADPAGLGETVTSSSQDTAYNLTIANLRKWINETSVSHHMESAANLMILMCPTLWGKLAAEVEARGSYTAGKKIDYGITSFTFDGHEVVSVPYLQTSTTMQTWLFILNLEYWELQVHKSRNFKVTPFVWQGDRSNGFDFWLARIMTIMNLVCWKPNSNLWVSNIS